MFMYVGSWILWSEQEEVKILDRKDTQYLNKTAIYHCLYAYEVGARAKLFYQ